jgi:hypothetical protein
MNACIEAKEKKRKRIMPCIYLCNNYTWHLIYSIICLLCVHCILASPIIARSDPGRWTPHSKVVLSCGPPIKLYHAHMSWRISLLEMQSVRRCWAFSAPEMQRVQDGLICIPLAAKVSAVGIFWCIVIQPNILTFVLPSLSITTLYGMGYRIHGIGFGMPRPWNIHHSMAISTNGVLLHSFEVHILY